MYIQITTRCNMSCAHCGMNCTQEGEDMTMETLKKVLNLGLSDSYIIGGVESLPSTLSSGKCSGSLLAIPVTTHGWPPTAV